MDDHNGVDRRAVMAGLGLAMSGFARPACAQDATADEAIDEPIQLLFNLFTRVGAAVMIDGRGPFTFVIDTGAGATSIADTVADQLSLPERNPVLIHGITEATVTRSVFVDRMHISGLAFHDLRCPVLPRSQL